MSMLIFTNILLILVSGRLHHSKADGSLDEEISLLEDASIDNNIRDSILESVTVQEPDTSRKLSVPEAWTQIGGDIDGELDADKSGESVAINADGTTVAIGAPFNDGNGNNSGHVRVYKFNGSEWVQKGVDIDGDAEFDKSGESETIALSDDGDTLAIGARGNDGQSKNYSGHIRVYQWHGTVWEKKGADIDGEAAGDGSGNSVSLSSDGNIVAIGAFMNGPASARQRGHVRIYAWNGSAWVQQGADIDGESNGDHSGFSVSLSGDGQIVAVGARANDGTGVTDSGHVRVFEWNGSTWVQKGSDIDGENVRDYSGYSVSISKDGSTVASGAWANDGTSGTDRGHVRVYAWDGSAWVQKGSDIDGEAPQDRSSRGAVSLNRNGNFIAIGAPFNDGFATSTGHARVYGWNSSTSTWNIVGADIDGESGFDYSGSSVALSDNGRFIAVGAPGNNGNGGSDRGHVRVFESPLSAVLFTAPPTTQPTPYPTAFPTFAPITIESSHPYGPNLYEVWFTEFTNINCYIVDIDTQSWTRELDDFVKIFSYDYVDGVPVFTQFGQRLYKSRLKNFGIQQVFGEGVKVWFQTDGGGGSWGFRLTIGPCPV